MLSAVLLLNTFTEYNELDAPVLINRRFVSPDGTCLSDMSYHYDNGGRETASALTAVSYTHLTLPTN